MQRKYRERYATIPIENLKEIIENELFPAALGICNRIRKKGEIEFNKRIKETISKCPLKECVILKGDPKEISKCPNPMCWIAEGPNWEEFLLDDIRAIYFMLTDIYIKALDIPEDLDKEITLVENPLNVMNRELKAKNAQKFIIEVFKKSKIFNLRTSVIKDILWAHNKAKYLLSVPLLIIQIEGILHDLAYHFKWKFEKKEMYGDEYARIEVIIKKLRDKYFGNTMVSFYKRQKGANESPRNLILHGRSLDYGRDNKLSTVLFLILTYLIAFSQMKIYKGATILKD